jgi:hypothetical protein
MSFESKNIGNEIQINSRASNTSKLACLSCAVSTAVGISAVVAPPETKPTPPKPEVAFKTQLVDYRIGNYASFILELAKKKHLHDPKNIKLTPAQIARKDVTPEDYKAWSKVNVCEEGGNWHTPGPEYPGGLGISSDNWDHYGGEYFSHTATTATPDEQIVVAMRIQKNPPDQYGCGNGW